MARLDESVAIKHLDNSRIVYSRRYLITSLIFVALLCSGISLVFPTLQNYFESNLLFNSVILALTAIGILLALAHLIMLRREILWLRNAIQGFKRGVNIGEKNLNNKRFPRLLASLAAFLRESQQEDRYLTLSATSLGTIVSVVASRVDENQETNRYLSGLLILVGLLGTFWGLLETIQGIVGAIGNMKIDSGVNTELFFNDLRDRLAPSLDGMRTAFSSSLFGLAGSLIVGFLSLQNGQAHNRFINDLEDWLTSLTRLTHEGGGSTQALENWGQNDTNANLDRLVRVVQMMEDNRRVLDSNLNELISRLGMVYDENASITRMNQRIEQLQDTIIPTLEKINTNLSITQDSNSVEKIQKNLENLFLLLNTQERINPENIQYTLERIAQATEQSTNSDVNAIQNRTYIAETLHRISLSLDELRSELIQRHN